MKEFWNFVEAQQIFTLKNLGLFFRIVKLHDLSHPEVDLYIAIEGVVVDVEGQLELSFFLDVGRLKQSQRI